MIEPQDRDLEIYDDRYYLNLPVDSGRIATLLDQLEFSVDDTVCEIGCAAGHFLTEIAPLISHGIGLDVAEPAIRAAKKIRRERGLCNVDFEQVSARDFASREENESRFDYVLLLDVTEHIGDDAVMDILEAAKRLMKPAGLLVIHTPNLDYWLEQLKDKGIVRQLSGHIAVRNERHYRRLIDEAGFGLPRVVGLPHYRQPLRLVDLLLSGLPWVGQLFRSRLFIVVSLQGDALEELG